MSREISTAEVRLVRCPKCERVLPEIADVLPLYRCGGCQTALQAKNRGAPKSASKVSETKAEAIRLPLGKTEKNGADSRVEEVSCVEAKGRRQHVDGLTHEYQSYEDKKLNWGSESSSSDDNGGRCCERVSDECFQGEKEEINLAQFDNSRKLSHNSTTVGPHPTHKYRQRQLISDTKNPLYQPHSESRQLREKAEEISDGSSDKLYPPHRNRLVNSLGSSSSDEVLNISPRPRQDTGSAHLKTHNTVSNLMPPDSSSKGLDRLEVSDRVFVKPSWVSGHHSPLISHEEANRVEARSSVAGFRKGLPGQVPSNGRVLHRPVDDSSAEWDYSVQIDGEVDHPMDHMIPNPYNLQSAPKNVNFGLLTDQSKSTQLEQQLQRTEMDMDWQKHNHHNLHSQVREKSLEYSIGPNKMDYKQITDNFQSSQHVQQSRDVRGRWPHLSGYKPLESDRPEFYLNSKGSSQFNENYDYGEFDYNGNLPQMYETEYQILQKRMELLNKLDELRDQLSRSCQVPYSSTVQTQRNIGRRVMTPGSRPIVMERWRSQNGHSGGFFPTVNDVESSCGDYSDRSQQSSGQLVYGPKMQSIPRVEQHQMHIANESLHGVMDEEDISNGFASKHINPQDFGHRMSHGYVEKRNATSHRIPQSSYSGEQGLNPQHQNYPFSHRSVNEEQTTCACCSRLSLQHPGGCCSHAYQDGNACHMPLHMPPTAFCQQQLHTAATHLHFNNSFPTRVKARDAPAHKHPCSYHEVSDIQKSKSQESEQILYQEKKYAPGPVTRKHITLSCSPFAGGAPFVLCDNCLQLLLIPRDLSPKMKKKHKLRCGTCFSIFVFTVWSKRQGITVAKHIDYPSRHMQGSHSKVQDLGISAANHATSSSSAIQNMLTNVRDIHDSPHSHVDDSDIYMSKSQSAHGKQDSLQLAPTVQNGLLKCCSVSSKPHLPMVSLDEKFKDFPVQDCDSSPKYLRDMRSYQARDNFTMAEGPPAPDMASPIAGSPLHEHFGYSSPLEMINKVRLEKATVTSHQKSVESGNLSHSDNTFGWKHTKIATKPDVAEMENQEELSKESSWSWNTSIKGFFKKSFKDLKKGNQGSEAVRSNVFVNGRPISDNLVKKAEEYAGPIQPGHYWYDYQAGFWGVMGEPCLGIIPPFIDEFNCPMPRDCAGGKTRILVNGRELHQKDLDRLAGRGLPITKDKSYHIEISGRVVDKATNTELKSLGKLAPTLEKEGHGLGMRAPRKRL
ncbi:uncharacterized protein LOC131060149 [Cryptomeria japonica]|uniref:uncharacterized protein LOC131060149 n=1 Tax=Cryptomeria japonica TaxID=3369 RepID=UPI0027DA29FC|nr:uncharacterized protein LOC131060149 [Cryptomeria japonica]